MSAQRSERSRGTALWLQFKPQLCSSTGTGRLSHRHMRLFNPVRVSGCQTKDWSVNPSLHQCCCTQLRYDLSAARTHTNSYLKLTRLILAGGSSVRSRSKAPFSTSLISCKTKTTTHNQSFSQHDDNSCSDKLTVCTLTDAHRTKQWPLCEYEEACRQLAKQSNAAINHLCRRRRESDRRTPSPYHAPLSFLHSMYISIRLPLPPPPSIPAPCQARLYF